MNITDLAQKAARAHSASRPNASLLRRLGIQPLVAIVFVLVDWFLFGGEVFSGMATLPISIMAGTALGVWAVWRQHVAYHDSIKRALIKGILLGVLTAIPTPLGSFFTAIGGLLPLFDKLGNNKAGTETENGSEPGMRNVTPGNRRPPHE